jgi:signal transduction histidine kinase
MNLSPQGTSGIFTPFTLQKSLVTMRQFQSYLEVNHENRWGRLIYHANGHVATILWGESKEAVESVKLDAGLDVSPIRKLIPTMQEFKGRFANYENGGAEFLKTDGPAVMIDSYEAAAFAFHVEGRLPTQMEIELGMQHDIPRSMREWTSDQRITSPDSHHLDIGFRVARPRFPASGKIKSARRKTKTSELLRVKSNISALLECAQAVLKQPRFEDSAPIIFDGLKRLTGASAGYVAVLSENGQENIVLFLDSGGRVCTVDPSLPMPVRGLRAQAIRLQKPVYHNDFSNSSYMELMPQGHVSLDNVMFASMIVEGRVVGLVGLANKEGGFDDEDAKIATSMAELAAICFHNTQMMKMVEDRERDRDRAMKIAARNERHAAMAMAAAVIAHEINNVTATIKGSESLLTLDLQDMRGSPQGKFKGDIEQIIKDREDIGPRLDRLILFNRSLMRLGMKDVVPARFDANAALDVARVLASSLFQERKVHLNYDFDRSTKQLYGKEQHFIQAIYNLLINAVQATPEGGDVEMITEQQGGGIRIKISDTGVGISEKTGDDIFNEYFSTKQNEGGTGLGLSFVKNVVEDHEGRITYESKLGEGTTFTLFFPQPVGGSVAHSNKE